MIHPVLYSEIKVAEIPLAWLVRSVTRDPTAPVDVRAQEYPLKYSGVDPDARMRTA